MTDAKLVKALDKCKWRRESAALAMLKAYRKYIMADKEWNRLMRNLMPPRVTCKAKRKS